MSPKVFEFPVLRSLGLSVGVAFLLSNASAMALPWTPSYTFSVSQADSSSSPPVVVDTEEPASTGTSTTRTSTGSSSSPAADSEARFSCQLVNGEYTVMYQPESEPNQSFPWATPSAMGDGWDPERRCYEISRRLESYRPDGLIELSTDVVNDYNTVCVTTEQVPDCRIVFTIPPGQDPLVTRDRVFQNIITADSGEQTDAVNTYRDRETDGIGDLFNWGREILGSENNSESINLRPFLDPADGGTGTKLQGGVPKPSNSPRLNPGNFRN